MSSTLSASEISSLSNPEEGLSEIEVREIFLPLTRLINMRVEVAQNLRRHTEPFATDARQRPFVIGICGSVAVGKSTFARALQAVLAETPQGRRIELVPTDGFLMPNASLQARGMMQRKGFPESYETHRLIEFLSTIRYGNGTADAPIYSHELYDVVIGKSITITNPEVLIIEGLNILQVQNSADLVSDFIDYSIYIDADIHDIENWYVSRFIRLKNTSFQRSASFFNHYANLGDGEATLVAEKYWNDINKPNLINNIRPTRERADIVIGKSDNHEVRDVWVRKA